MQNLPIRRNLDSLAGVDYAHDVVLRNFPVCAGDGDHAMALSEDTCAPPTETTACSVGMPVIRSAFSKAVEMAETASSISTMTPRRIPAEGASPTPIIDAGSFSASL